MCFKTYLNHPINNKTSQKKLPKAITVLKKEGSRGGVRRGMIIITDSMVFFLCLPLCLTFKEYVFLPEVSIQAYLHILMIHTIYVTVNLMFGCMDNIRSIHQWWTTTPELPKYGKLVLLPNRVHHLKWLFHQIVS